MNSNPILAHPGQSLADHLDGVSRLAEQFASCFEAALDGQLAGLLHDLGKAEEEFQKRLRHATCLGKSPVMAESVVNIHAAKTQLSQLVARAEKGERITIARRQKRNHAAPAPEANPAHQPDAINPGP